MERINKICQHRLWLDCLAKIKSLEKERIFCKHDINHFLDVARIAYIENLENNLAIAKELIYASALLHDIGRHKQYLEGIPHDEASVMIAKEILADCDFTDKETNEILEAIKAHRNKETVTKNDLAGIIYRADKKSRNCLFCLACSECNWSDEKKNLLIER